MQKYRFGNDQTRFNSFVTPRGNGATKTFLAFIINFAKQVLGLDVFVVDAISVTFNSIALFFSLLFFSINFFLIV